MAYGNWGGKVWVDGVPLHDHCDITPAMVLEDKRYAHYLQHYAKPPQETQFPLHKMYHAIVGDQAAGVLVCLYKCWIATVIQLDPFEEVKPRIEDVDLVFTTNSIEISYKFRHDPERGIVEFTDKDGRKWKGIAGYGLGEGYEKWD